MRKIFGVLIALMMLPQAAHAFRPSNVRDVIARDVAVVGPGGEVLIYYKDGNDIVVRNCGNGYPIIKKRSDCVMVGQENRVPVAHFKRVLKSEFEFTDADKLKPVTADDVAAYKKADPAKVKQLKQQEKELDAKLARIKKFIEKYGADDKSNKDLADTDKLLAQVRKELTTANSGEAAIKKVNDLIDDLVDKKIAASAITVASYAKSNDQAMYTLLKQYDASKAECGTDEIINGTPVKPATPGGKPAEAFKATMLENLWITPAFAAEITTDQRIKDCSVLSGSSKKTKAGVSWNLVARKRDRATGKFNEVWKDSKSGLLWGDTLDSDYSHYNAVELSATGKVLSEKACASDEGKKASAGIREKSFGLPTIEEFQKAEQDGIREVVPNMYGHWFWSASLYPSNAYFARVFSGYDGYSYSRDDRDDDDLEVRCVGR